MKIAVEGCAHGELDTIYQTIEFVEKKEGFKIDLLLCCGDFQSVRNKSDLTCMAVPATYRKLNTFYKYYSGEKKAPVLTIFIGGNHEASNYLAELPYGGWVCPNIYYIGYAGILNIGGLRIGGLSGIYKGIDYLKGHFEMVPFSEATKRSVYHVRNLDVFRLKQISQPIDIFMSHDWPRNICKYGHTARLLKKKPFFKEDIESGKLGSRPAEELLEKLKPAYWFAAHLHVKFAALVPHNQDENGPVKYTKFLALDKCLPRRKFLQILDIPHDDRHSLELHYDPEWLCILRSTNHLFSVAKGNRYMPGPGSSQRWDFQVREGEMSDLEAIFQGNYKVPLNFEQTDPPHDTSAASPKNDSAPRRPNRNPQTTSFAKKLGITDPLTMLLSGGGGDASSPTFSFISENEINITQTINPEGISIDDEVEDDDDDEDDDEIELESFSVFRTTTFDSSATVPTTFEDEGNSASQDDDELMVALVTGPSFPPRPSVSPRWEPPEYRSPSSDAAKRQQGEGESANGDASTASSDGSAKKFKRRNFAIYASAEDEGDD